MDKKILIQILAKKELGQIYRKDKDIRDFYLAHFGACIQDTRDILELVPEDKLLQYIFDKFSAYYTHQELADYIDNISCRKLRRCSHCGMPMKEGYYIDGQYACGNQCAIALYDGNKEQFNEDLRLEEELNDDVVYYTEWNDYFLDEINMYDKNCQNE